MIVPKGITLAALVAYLPLTLVATAWIRFGLDRRPVEVLLSTDTLLRDLLYGFGVASATLAFSVVASRTFQWAKFLEREFRSFLGPLTLRELVGLAALSSLAEEAFFRGALQPTIGLVPSAILFGLAHVGPWPRFLPWTLFATTMGLVLGWLFQTTGNLAAAFTAHFLINLINLGRIVIRPPDSPAESFPPRRPHREAVEEGLDELSSPHPQETHERDW